MSSETDVIIIPTFPPSPPTTSSRQMSTSPEWFTTPVKAAYKPSPLSISIPLNNFASYGPRAARRSSSDDETLSEVPSTPPLSPASTIGSFDMCRKDSNMSSCSSGSDGDCDEVLVTPAPRPSTPRRTSGYFDLEAPSRKSKKTQRKLPGVPVTGLIEPMWRMEEQMAKKKTSPPATAKLLEPFKMTLPTQAGPEPKYTLDEHSFVLAHVPAKSVSLSAFRPRMIRVPRWQRPIVIVVMSVLLFGTLCMVSFFQQSIVSAERAIAIKQGEWLAKNAAMAQAESDLMVESEPGYKSASPKHHSLKVQAKLAKRAAAGQSPMRVSLEMTKAEELAALMNFIVGTTANTLPEIDLEDSTSLEGFLPFNPRSPNAKAELAELVRSQWEDYPIMVLGNMRDPKMREARALFKKYNVKPSPFYVDIDQRTDSSVLSSTLEHVLGKQEGPYVLLAGKNIGTTTKLVEHEKKETLIETIAKTGASIAKRLKRNKHQREEERRENERVLGPKPVLMA
ncbi:hypothetical protein L202_00135 [Cryptococcus amylolentus CBS 6039]|uniref:Uncharacterized protein n=1 Tax=Cryptococcus amylolentus CBS 6039 TaxID=1295533 RepID=A0A1E3I6Y8_9TREE|nr:hypothetical protein L202_00135 [Cryptococcus amylolentus CBS 6039]ODN84125.1 hypothetical protein L202_00135 [Cryptococcus amylolentus CBS 6039]